MKRQLVKLFSLFLASTFVFSCKSEEKPRIGIAGLSIECSTFSPAQTHEDAFRVYKGDQVMKIYPFFTKDSSLLKRAHWLPSMVSAATPGGIVTRECYESLVGQTLERLKANAPYDALYLDIHGAMSVVGLDDPEGDFIKRVREVVGKDAIISTSMDLHGCVTHRLAQESDLLTCFRLAPHEDRYITKERAITNLLERIETGKGKPKYKAWVKVPILLPGEKTSTRIEPGKSLYAKIENVLEDKGVIDASIWVSYAWADEPRNHGVVFTYGDDKEAVGEAARNLAQSFWDVREKFEFVAPTSDLQTCLKAAYNSEKKPYFISDMGDNPTAGGAGDVSWTLERLLEEKTLQDKKGPSFVYASIPGPEFIEKALKAGIGKTVTGKVGAMVDNRYAGPIELTGKITAIHESERNVEVVAETGSMKIIVTKLRQPYHYEKDFLKLGIKPRETDIVMVKVGYLTEELYAMQADWMMAHTKGGVDQDIEELPYKRIIRPMFPLDRDMENPDFTAVFIPQS